MEKEVRMSERNFKSNTIIQCGHPFCLWRGARRYLKRHSISKHYGFIKEKSADEQTSGGDCSSSSDATASAILNDAVLATMGNGESTNENSPNQILASMVRTTIMTGLLSQIEQSHDSIIDRIDKLQDSRTETPSEAAKQPDASVVKTKSMRLRTISDICSFYPGLVFNEESGELRCEPCATISNYSLGVFKYDSQQGDSFPYGSRQADKFSSLKNSIRRHYEGAKHKKLTKTMTVKEKKISQCIYYIGYYVLKSSMGSQTFTDLLQLNGQMGLDIGNLNHSRYALSRLRDSFAEEITHSVSEFCRASPCVSWIADKVTIKNKIYEIIGIVGIIPGATAGNLFQSMAVDATLVGNCDGESMSRTWMEVAKKLDIDTTKLAAIETDGEYLKNEIPFKFLQLMDENAEECFNIPYILGPGHLIEFAAKSLKNKAWIKAANSIITAVSRVFSSQKARLATVTAGFRLKKPILFSETRWCAYAERVYRTFLDNISTYVVFLPQLLEDRSRNVEPLLESFMQQAEELKCRAASLFNIYSALAETISSLEEPQKFPWEKLCSYSNMMRRLHGMQQNVLNMHIDTSYWTSCELVQTLSRDDAGLVADALHTLLEHLKLPPYGYNGLLLEHQENMRIMGDMQLARSFECPVSRSEITFNAFQQLQSCRLIPFSVCLTQDDISTALCQLQSYKTGEEAENQELYKFLLSSSDAAVKSYLDVVTRIWLMHPSKSVVESMANTLKHIQGGTRNLLPENLGKELVIQVNGPPINEARKLVEIVIDKHPMKTSKSSRKSSKKSLATSRVKKEEFHLNSLYS